jgi:dCTP deaminase
MGREAYVTSTASQTKTILRENEQIVIPPGQFANLLTDEIVEIPSTALGFISVKLRLKQRGLINVSGFHVDPGFRGRLLFSVYNAGANPGIITRGDRAFLLWYASLERATRNLYEGSRRLQMELSSEDVMRLQGDVASPEALAEKLGALETRLTSTSPERLAERLTTVEQQLRFRSNLLWVIVTAVVTVVLTAVVTALITLAVDGSTSTKPTSPSQNPKSAAIGISGPGVVRDAVLNSSYRYSSRSRSG